MRILAKTNIGTRDLVPVLMEGEEREIDNQTANQLIASGVAVRVEPEPEPIRAIPDQPAIAETAEPEIKADKPIRQRPKRKAIIDIKPKHKDS